MPVTIKEVEHIARLAKLEFSPGEKERLAGELNRILSYMAKLNELDTAGVEPLAQVVTMQNVLREDVTRPPLPRDEALRNAPDRTGEFFTVPKVIEGE
jgi:aspartyl-tRNA(Asn)/glutamyl-tRNA(Gln) amidotransferase subunit C